MHVPNNLSYSFLHLSDHAVHTSHRHNFCCALVNKLCAKQDNLKRNRLEAISGFVTFVHISTAFFNTEAVLLILQLRRAHKIDISPLFFLSLFHNFRWQYPNKDFGCTWSHWYTTEKSMLDVAQTTENSKFAASHSIVQPQAALIAVFVLFGC